MDSAYIRALNAGLLQNNRSDGQVRDKAILREAKRLYRATPPKVAPETNARVEAVERSTIPPPNWREPPK
jgi:hypothetical protein